MESSPFYSSASLPHLKQRSPPFELLEFLRSYHKGGELHLALSGGGDSLSLLYSLLLLREPLHLSIVLLHVNHGLREESLEEERLLSELANAHSLPLYVERLHLERGGNLEERAREGRYQFFERIFLARRELGHAPEALLLGHHGHGQGETLLKRIFEGAPLIRWRGMERVAQRGALPLWRPLLGMKKAEILHWLKEIQVTPFEDRTNQSDENLRGRMRGHLLPLLERAFGKRVVGPLLRLREEIGGQVDLLDALSAPYSIEEEPFSVPPLHKALQKHLIRRWLERRGSTLSYASLEQLIASLPLEGRRSFPTSTQELTLQNGRISF